MDIKEKIKELASSTAHNSITPESLGAILMALYEATEKCMLDNTEVIANIEKAIKESISNFSITTVTECDRDNGLTNGYNRLSDGSVKWIDMAGWINFDYRCKPGDTFVISGYGGNAPRLWGFLDNDENLIECAEPGGEVYKEVVAPENAATFICNMSLDESSKSYIPPFIGRMERKKVNAVWKGPHKAFLKMAECGQKDENTAYIISD